jgi:hypothetical protein
MYVEYVTNQLEFLPAQPGFACWHRLDRIFFLVEVLFFPQAMASQLFFLVEDLFYRKPT